MSEKQIFDEVDRLSTTNNEFSNQIQALNMSMMELDEARFEKILSTNIIKMGFEQTMIMIVFPFLERVGTLWAVGAISPAHEHFITNLIRQKLIVAIDGIVIKPNLNSKKILTYLPEGELHEISLLFCQYLLKSNDHDVVHLGASVPFEDLSVIGRIHQPDIIISVITIPPVDHSVENYVERLSRQFLNSNIILCGRQISDLKDLELQNIKLARSLQEIVSSIEGFSGPGEKIVLN